MKKLHPCNLTISCFESCCIERFFCEALPTKLPYFSFFCLHQQTYLGLGKDQKHLSSATDRLQLAQLFLTWWQHLAAQTHSCRVNYSKPYSTLANLIAAEMHVCIGKQGAQ